MTARRLRETLDRLGYTTAGILEVVGAAESAALPLAGKDLPVLLHRTRGGRPLDLLIRLFLLGTPVDVDALRDAVGADALAEWHAMDLVATDGRSTRAELELLPYADFVIAFDFDARAGAGLRPDYVMGVGRSTLTLANITVRRRSQLTLDLGTGCGVQAFLAARHSDRVIGVDRNPRAITLARFNAALNSFENTEFIEGDLLEPVVDRRFDLVVSNPPFVISPAARYIYRDGGMEGDQLCQKIVREVPRFLNEGGYCQILCNWAGAAGESWDARLADWFHATGCDAWVIRSETHDAATYAATWIQHTEGGDAAQRFQYFNEWLAYYERQHIETMSAGIITMRRASGRPNWFRADQGPEKMFGPSGDDVIRLFALRDFLEAHRSNDDLLEERLRLSPHVRLAQQCAASPEGWNAVQHELRLVKGLGYVGRIDAYVARLLVRCDGRRSLRELIAELAEELPADPQRLGAECVQLVRQLIERGFVWRANLDRAGV